MSIILDSYLTTALTENTEKLSLPKKQMTQKPVWKRSKHFKPATVSKRF